MRPLAPLLLTAALLGAVLAGCGPSPGSNETRSRADSAAATDERPAPDRRALALARRLAARTDSIFQTIEPLFAREKARLRRYLQPQHLERARRLGLDPVRDRRTAADLEQDSARQQAVRLRTNAFYIVDPSMSYAVAVTVPSTAHLLERLGRRFQSSLLRQGLPPYRFVLTNVLRTAQDQAALRGTNVNAAQGQSTHEYGTTFDVFYEWFHYAAVHDTLARSALPPADSARARAGEQINKALLRERLYAAYLQDGDQHARKIKAVLGRTILEMQDEGLLLATYERSQPVFHVTVARTVEAPAQAFTPPLPDSIRQPRTSG